MSENRQDNSEKMSRKRSCVSSLRQNYSPPRLKFLKATTVTAAVPHQQRQLLNTSIIVLFFSMLNAVQLDEKLICK